MPTTDDVSVNDVIENLLNFNRTGIQRYTDLIEKIETDLTYAFEGGLQGETEEFLKMILDGIIKMMESLVSLQEDLQASLIESYFPAQD